MMARSMRLIGRLVVGHPGLVTTLSLIITLLLYANIHNLRTGTDLADLFGNRDPQWRAASQIGKELGYGNQLFVVVEAPSTTTAGIDVTTQMEDMADRLAADMQASGLFVDARCGLKDEELLKMVRFFTWNFPSFARPGQIDALKQRLDPKQIHENVRRAATELVSPFSSLGTNYFVADPLGLMPVITGNGQGLSEFANFDLNWGSGNRFFSKDHDALLIVAEPRQSAMDYNFAEQVMQWTREHIQSMSADPDLRASGVQATAAGAYVYAEQEHRLIERNIRRISLISIIGNLLLCLAIYPRIPLLLLSLLPASLGILWTTGIAASYPGEVNLISLSFIAILAGLGDDQIVHFFNRVPQQWAKGGTLNDAVLRTFETTGLSVFLCIVTAATATVSLATAKFKGLSEFGFILTVGMFMMMLHTLLTVPALLQLWWKISKPREPQTITFRLLPLVAQKSVDFVGRHARLVLGLGVGVFLLSSVFLPTIRFEKHFEIAGNDNPAVAAQNLLSQKFGIEGSPHVMLIAGGEQEVLNRAEKLTSRLEDYQHRGVIKSIFSPTFLLPSAQTQTERASLLAGVNFVAAARALENALRANGFRIDPIQPFIDRLRQLGNDRGLTNDPITLETAAKYLPPGLLNNSIRKTRDASYVAAIAFYGANPDAVELVPPSVIESWRTQLGGFTEFSFDAMNRDLQRQVLHDSRKALGWTAAGILLIVYLCFRSVRVSLIALIPIIFGVVATFGLLLLVRHRFSFISITAIPLIIGIGIDNGIHLVRRYLESESNDILAVTKASGAALIQSNLTTMVGFGALMTSSFAPLVEMGLVTTLGVALALAGGLLLIPAVFLIGERRRPGSLQS
ncbi:MAG TPA: MMPL family transporter [Terriglobales bacterium]|nr:MMPL family transporter [Terriglobales bacterium]